jgi:hypothetical protein
MPAAANSSEVIGLVVLFARGTCLRKLKAKNVKQLVRSKVLTVNFCQPSHEFTFNIGIDLLF